MENRYSITVIIPVYNEKDIIFSSVTSINDFFITHFNDYEIIIVESGSTDGSYKLCDKVAKSDKHIKIIHEGERNGFGSAVKVGYRAAEKELILLYTLDLPFPLESVSEAIPLLDKYDYVLSYRSKDNRGMLRNIQSFVYNMLIKTVLGLKAKHANSGFKIYRRKHVVDLEIVSNGWFIDAEVLYLLKEQKYTFTQIPVKLIDRTQGRSSVGVFSFVAILKEMYIFLKHNKALKAVQQ